jgi:hypothetical protein
MPDKSIYDSMAFQRGGLRGQGLLQAVQDTGMAKAKGSALGLGTALSLIPAVRVGQRVSAALAPRAFDAGRRGFMETMAQGSALVALGSRLPAPQIARTAQSALKATRPVTQAVQRFTGHRLGTPVPSIDVVAGYEKALKAGQALPGRLGLNLHNIRKAMSPAEEAIRRFANVSPMPPAPPNPVINQSLNISNRLVSPTGMPMSPRVFQQQLNTLRGPVSDVW